MEEISSEVKYDLRVAYNNEVMVASRKKQNKVYGKLMLLAALVFVIFTILSAVSENSSGAVVAIFAVFVAVCVLLSLYYFFSKPNKKNDSKSFEYIFYEDYLEIYKDDEIKNTHKSLTKCLYRPYSNKQYVAKVIESVDKFELKIYTGTVNGVPKFDLYYIPKEIVKNEQLEQFTEFLKERLGKDYLIKTK